MRPVTSKHPAKPRSCACRCGLPLRIIPVRSRVAHRCACDPRPQGNYDYRRQQRVLRAYLAEIAISGQSALSAISGRSCLPATAPCAMDKPARDKVLDMRESTIQGSRTDQAGARPGYTFATICAIRVITCGKSAPGSFASRLPGCAICARTNSARSPDGPAMAGPVDRIVARPAGFSSERI